MNKLLYVIPAAVLVLVASYYGLRFMANTNPIIGSDGASNGQTSETGGQMTQTVKEFTVLGFAFGFSPSTIEVNKSDVVKITFTSTDVSHDLVIENYNVGTDILTEGKSQTIEFVADKAGTFEFYCSVDGHREAGMVGKLIVDS